MESQGVSTNYPRTRPRRFVSVLKDITPTTQNLVETNARSRRLSGSLIAAPPLSKAIEKKKESTEEQQKKRSLLSRRRSIDPSVLSRPNAEIVKKSSTPVTTVESNTRIRRFSGSGLNAHQHLKDDKPKNEEITPKKTVTLNRRRTIDPCTLSRNEQPSLDDAQQKLRTLAIIAEKRKEKREVEERKKKEDEERAESYEEKFKSFKTKALMIRNANGKLTERIVNLQNEMMEINCRLSQLTTERVIHMIETVLNA